MYCYNCGVELPDGARFCKACGSEQKSRNEILKINDVQRPEQQKTSNNKQSDTLRVHNGRQLKSPRTETGPQLVGFSPKINDPAFQKYIKNTNRWAAIFSIILAIGAVIGFFIAGEVGTEMDNPQSLYIGFGIGGMFLVIAFFQILGRKRSKTWDGTVEDKKIKKKTEQQRYGNDDIRYEDYLEYSVIILPTISELRQLKYCFDKAHM